MGQTSRKTVISGLIGFEILFKFACLSLCFPLVREGTALCMKLSGYSYLTRENIVSFLLKPFSLLFFFLLFLLLAFLLMFEMCAVNLALRQKKAGLRVNAVGLFYGGFERTHLLFQRKRSGIAIALFTFLFVFFLGLPQILFLFLGIRQTEGVIWKILEPVGLLVCLLGIVVLWWVALFGCAVILVPGIDRGEVGAFGKIARRVRKNYHRLLRGLLRRSFLLTILEGAVYLGGLVLLILIVTHLTPKEYTVTVLMHYFVRYHMIINILFFSANTVIYEFFCADLFYETHGPEQHTKFTEEETGFSAPNLESRFLRKKKLFLGMVGVVCISVGISTFFFFKNGSVLLAETLDQINITAHRGASGEAPENTIASISLAVDKRTDYVELDVRLTKDEIPVLSHDASLYRMTGVAHYIRNLTFEELSGYDVGRKFGEEYEGEYIPSLREVFEEFGGEVGFNLDLKPYGDDPLPERVIELIEEFHLEDSCLITSTSYEVLERVKMRNSEIKTGYIMDIVYGNFETSPFADFYSMRSGFVTDMIVKKAHEVGKEVHVWTVNTKNELLRMKAIGVDNIITDYPDRARTIIGNENLVDTIAEILSILLPGKDRKLLPTSSYDGNKTERGEGMATRIVLDAGHGGYDNGAVYKGRNEKDDNLELTLAVGEILEKEGFDVVYTRKEDYYDSPVRKARIANEAGGDYFISFHRNSSEKENQYNGVEVLVYDEEGVKKDLADAVNRELSEVGYKNLGIDIRKDLTVLRRTRMPAILIETGFLNNDSDNALFDEKFEETAEAIAKAVTDVLKNEE